MDQHTNKPSSFPWLGLVLLWLVGWTLRVPVLATPPLATRIAEDAGMGETGLAALTMLPLLTIAFGALAAAWLVARLGVRVAIVGGMMVMAAASTARGLGAEPAWILVMSALMGLGVAAFQTALPAATRIWTPTHAALGSAVYLNGMMVGEFFGAGLTLPVVLPLADGDWRMALLVWCAPVLAIALAVLVAGQCLKVRGAKAESMMSNDQSILSGRRLPHWNDAQVWQFGLLLGASIVVFYAINAYAGALMAARGDAEATAAFYLAFNLTPLAASILLLWRPGWIGRRTPLGVSSVVAMVGMALFAMVPGPFGWAGAVVAGLASTVMLILLMALPPAIASGQGVTRMTAGMTLIGYGAAFSLPLIGGQIADATGRTDMALVPSLMLAIAAIPLLGRSERYRCNTVSM